MCWEITELTTKEFTPIYGDRTKALRESLCCGGFVHWDGIEANFQDYCWNNCNQACIEALGLSDMDRIVGVSDQYITDSQFMSENRKFFATNNGRYGLGSHLLQDGDLCAILFRRWDPFHH
jgi:hypothetical protein